MCGNIVDKTHLGGVALAAGFAGSKIPPTSTLRRSRVIVLLTLSAILGSSPAPSAHTTLLDFVSSNPAVRKSPQYSLSPPPSALLKFTYTGLSYNSGYVASNSLSAYLKVSKTNGSFCRKTTERRGAAQRIHHASAVLTWTNTCNPSSRHSARTSSRNNRVYQIDVWSSLNESPTVRVKFRVTSLCVNV